MSSSTKSSPPLNIPSSTSTINVYIIDTTTRINGVPIKLFMEPKYKGIDVFTGVPSFSFLIEHPPTGRKFLFDLGIRKDPENLPPRLVKIMEKGGWSFTAEKNVVEILAEGGVDPEDINGIIWRYVRMSTSPFCSEY